MDYGNISAGTCMAVDLADNNYSVNGLSISFGSNGSTQLHYRDCSGSENTMTGSYGYTLQFNESCRIYFYLDSDVQYIDVATW